MGKCGYKWNESSHWHSVICQLNKNHDGDHAFYFKTDPKDIEHEHKWVKIYEKGSIDWNQLKVRDRSVADTEYRCSFCRAKRLEYY